MKGETERELGPADTREDSLLSAQRWLAIHISSMANSGFGSQLISDFYQIQLRQFRSRV